MNIDQSKPGKTARPLIESLRIILGTVAALAAVTLLVLNIMAFMDAVNYYRAMGYPSGEVYKQLIPTQLLPGVFEPLAIYGGVALLLFYVGILNQKISNCQALLTEPGSEGGGEESVVEPEALEEEQSAAEPGAVREDDNPAETTDS